MVDTGYSTRCRIWKLNKTFGGYGLVRHRGRMQCAHRVAYEQRFGPIPEGKQLDHLCRVRACVNPDHLEPVSAAENIRRGSNTKLTVEEVREIRASTAPQEEIAREYGISQPHVSKIRSGESWADV